VKLDSIQEHLEAIYGVRCELKVSDYLLGPDAARSLGGTGRSNEELLVHESDDGLELGLFVAPQVLEQILPLEGPPAAGALRAYCEAAEGVSHFLYLQQVAHHDRQVSLLELETQAEIDKFATLGLTGLRTGASGARWIERLFGDVRYLDGLTEEEGARYREANRLAKAYCQRLVPLLDGRRLERLLAELRKTYRLGAEAKLQYLRR